MRFVVFFLGFLACSITIAVGGALVGWDSFLALLRENADANIQKQVNEIPTTSLTLVSHANAGLVVAIAGAYGMLGSLFVVFRCGKQGGTLMLVAVLGAGFMNPWVLPFLSFQAFVGLLSLFIGPLPLNPPTEKAGADEDEEEEDEEEDEDEDEEEEEKPRAKKKR